MIGIVNYGAGNLKSVIKAFNYLKIETKLIENVNDFENVKKVVLPGVGAFKFAMDNLKKLDLANYIKNWIFEEKPLLGICLGMQLFLNGSEENPNVEGLSVVDCICKKFKVGIVPQIGWNNINYNKNEKLFYGLENNSYFYFVHSYYVEENEFAISKTNYNVDFCSTIKYKNSYGVQFHPEKSGKNGLLLLKNWVDLC